MVEVTDAIDTGERAPSFLQKYSMDQYALQDEPMPTDSITLDIQAWFAWCVFHQAALANVPIQELNGKR